MGFPLAQLPERLQRQVLAQRGVVMRHTENKYHNIRTQVDGIPFASKAEARRYQALRLQHRTKAISRLRVHPVYPLIVKGEPVGTYIADFEYRLPTGVLIIEDVKSPATSTPTYKLKKKLMQAIYGITVREVPCS